MSFGTQNRPDPDLPLQPGSLFVARTALVSISAYHKSNSLFRRKTDAQLRSAASNSLIIHSSFIRYKSIKYIAHHIYSSRSNLASKHAASYLKRQMRQTCTYHVEQEQAVAEVHCPILKMSGLLHLEYCILHTTEAEVQCRALFRVQMPSQPAPLTQHITT